MPQCVFSDRSIGLVLRRANAEKRKRHKWRKDGTKFRPLGFDFAKAFVELLSRGYSKEQGKNNPRTFEQLMESLLITLSCSHADTRHGYKQIAGLLFEPHSRFARELKRRAGTESALQQRRNMPAGLRGIKPVRVIAEGRQLGWRM